MARDLKDSIDTLNATISRWTNLPRGSWGTPVRREQKKLERKESGPSFKKRARMVALQSRIESDYELIKQSDKLFKAQAFMIANPNSFRSAARKVRFDEIMSQRRKRDRKLVDTADRTARMHLLSITDPDAYHRAVLEEKYKYATGGGSFAADTIINAERRKKAEDIHKERRSRDRKRSIASDQTYKRLMMDDFEGSIYDLMKDGLSRKQAEDVYVRQNAKWLSIIAKNYPKISKHIPQIAKTLGSISGIPGLGMVVAHPGLAALTMLGFGIGSANRAMKSVAEWQISGAYTGTPKGNLLKNLYDAGLDRSSAIKQYGTIASWLASLGTNQDAWKVISDILMVTRGKLDLSGIYERSSVEDLGRKIAEQMPNLSLEERIRALGELSRIGINSNVLKAFEYTYGSETATPEQKWSGFTERIGDTIKENITGILGKTISGNYDIPIKNIKNASLPTVVGSPLLNGILSTVNAVKAASLAAEIYDAQSPSSSTDNSKTVTWNVNIEKVEASNVDEMIAEIKRRGSMSSNSYAMIIEDNDNREIA